MSDSAKSALLHFFSAHLDRIYCGKQHLINSLPALTEQAHFGDLKLAISELREDVHKQIDRMNEIYKLLQVERDDTACKGMSALLEEMFEGLATFKSDRRLCDLSLIFYLQNIESIESASFQMLRLTAENLGNESINQLLMESVDEAKEDRSLLLQISKKFMALRGQKT